MILSNIFRKSPRTSGSPRGKSPFGHLFLAAFLVGTWAVSGPDAAFVSVILLFAYALPIFLLRILHCRISGRPFPTPVAFLASYASAVGFVLAAGSAYAAAFAVWQNEIDPAPLPEITLSNGDKTVRFRTMAHVASRPFYDGVAEEIAAARGEGYAVFYEGVRPGTPENARKLDRLMGFRFDGNLYAAMATLYGLVPQDTRSLLGTPGPDDRNADIGVDELVAFAEKRR